MAQVLFVIGILAQAATAAAADHVDPPRPTIERPMASTLSDDILRRERRLRRVTPAGGAVLAAVFGLQASGVIKVRPQPDYSGHRKPGDTGDATKRDALVPMQLKLPQGMH